MNLAYWGFRYWPFERTFAADRYFASPLNDEAMSRLLFLVEEFRRSGVVIGPHGTGKTYLLKLVGQRAERMGRRVVRCEATGLESHEFLAQVAAACLSNGDLQLMSPKIWNGLRARFAAWGLVRQPLVLLVDHFDSGEAGCLQAIQRLEQLADTVGLKLTVILAAAEESIPEALLESIELRIDLASWTSQETGQFIQSAIEQAGCKRPLFSRDAIKKIHEITNGVPAKIVSLGNLCLLAARAHEEDQVTSQAVDACAPEVFPHRLNAGGKHRSDSWAYARERNDKSVVHDSHHRRGS